ncbi:MULTISPECIES: phosphonoacetaldehyde reductase [unclassified Lentimicrobium]|uniref:phosphonoacetaldehyde reductase n=1 Tax=unclassified Lentimicrobium TaxID=2677434 RepID=UPI001557F5EE|nr:MULTISPECIES: phosphonoacetaldehyde reductase [unclassified Lentimicrobium]NPD45458.1 phosphonoacetaldehyde reductase [Lentimicrobium sp. S6]NPD86089.1 phosphonoacetaldehyde reductase [Lentimicrobium sp. L6]
MQIVFKENRAELTELIKVKKYKNIFLVKGGKSYTESGAKKFIEDTFQITDSFSGFDNNPQIEDLKKGIENFQQKPYDCIIAIGGGSVLDMAKLISVFTHQSHSIEDIILNNSKINNQKTPLLAIPTTSGTGAEATAFSVLYVNKKKYSVASKTMLPNYAYLSSSFSLTANKYLTACTGADAFCQAVESIWSINSNSESQEYALKAIELAWKNLPKAVNNNAKAKELMLEASFLAGKAINISKTTAPHAISYAFTSYYGIPHGHAVSLSLAYFFEFNCYVSQSNCNDKRGKEEVLNRLKKILSILGSNETTIKNDLNSFFKSIGLENKISILIESFNPELIIENVNIQRLKNNPRNIESKELQNFINLLEQD